MLLMMVLIAVVSGGRTKLSQARGNEFLRSCDFVAYHCKKIGDLIYERIQSKSDIEVSYTFEYEAPLALNELQIALICYVKFDLATEFDSWKVRMYEIETVHSTEKHCSNCPLYDSDETTSCFCYTKKHTTIESMVEIVFKEFPGGHDEPPQDSSSQEEK